MSSTFVLVNKEDSLYIGVDSSSGYPFLTEDLGSAKLWPSAKEAVQYNAVVNYKPEDRYKWALHKVYTDSPSKLAASLLQLSMDQAWTKRNG